MAGIGDYVHFSKANYKKYGISKNDEGEGKDISSIYNTQKNICLERARRGQLDSGKYEKIEKFLSGMMYGKDSDGTSYNAEAIKELQSRVTAEFNKKFPQFGINFGQGLNVYYKGKSHVTQKQSISINGLKEYLKTIQSMANGSIEMNKNFNLDQINNVINQLEHYINSHSDNNPSQTISFSQDAVLADLIGNINRVLKMQSIPRSNAIGEVFEIWLAIASQYAEGKAESITDELLEEIIKGSNRTKITISGDKFSKELVDLSSILGESGFGPGQWNYIDENNSYEFSAPSQDKLDVVFQWGGDELAVSAKNYGFSWSNDIHLLSGSSLLYLISGENSDFVNHWLNCLVQSPDQAELSDNVISSAHFTMQLSILTQSLLGSKGALADTFILNDRKNRRIYVRSMSSIVHNIIQLSNNKPNLKGVTISNYPMSMANSWYGSEVKSDDLARMRITKLLSDIHKIKISTSINVNQLPKI